MKLEIGQQLESTKRKLLVLERMPAELRAEPGESEYSLDYSRISLGRLIKQLKEEIILYEIHSRRKDGALHVPT